MTVAVVLISILHRVLCVLAVLMVLKNNTYWISPAVLSVVFYVGYRIALSNGQYNLSKTPHNLFVFVLAFLEMILAFCLPFFLLASLPSSFFITAIMIAGCCYRPKRLKSVERPATFCPHSSN